MQLRSLDHLVDILPGAMHRDADKIRRIQRLGPKDLPIGCVMPRREHGVDLAGTDKVAINRLAPGALEDVGGGSKNHHRLTQQAGMNTTCRVFIAAR